MLFRSEVAAAKQALMRAASHRCLLVDSSKFRPRAFMQVGSLEDMDELITDRDLPVAEKEYLHRLRLRVTLADR